MRPMTDVVVLLPGITGSVLRDDRGRDLWAPTAGTVARALVTLGRSVSELELLDENVDDGVTAPVLIPDLHLIPGLWKIDGYSKLSAYLQRQFAVTPGRNFFAFPYDWRRDNRVAARRLKDQTDRWLREWRRQVPDAKLILVAHSMGGLVARYFLECLEGWRDTRRLVTFGTPYRGSLNALDFLLYGWRKSLGPVPMPDLSRLLQSFPSVYQLLPIYPCLDQGDGRLVRVSEAAGLPQLDPVRVRAADAFHREIERAVAAHQGDEAYRCGRYTIHPIAGTFQATLLSARQSGRSVEMLRSYPGFAPDGDGTVPRVSATPIEFPHEEGAMFAAERHGSLQYNDGVLAQLAGLLSGQDTARVRAGTAAGLELDDAFGPGEPITFRYRAADPMAPLTAVVTTGDGRFDVARSGNLPADAGRPGRRPGDRHVRGGRREGAGAGAGQRIRHRYRPAPHSTGRRPGVA
jgi:pimeloyl-ACP methyl ester carboxylesterase